MPDLETLLAQRPTFSLEELADAANELLHDLLPRSMSDSRVKAEVNPRLIRHYVSEEMLDPAIRDGRRVVYTVDHLLQLLALRRLLADGYSSTIIGAGLRRRAREELRTLAEGGDLEHDAVPSAAHEDASTARSEARAALDAIRSRVASGGARSLSSFESRFSRRPSSAPPHASDPSADPVTWERVPLLDGVELHVRSDLRLPDSMDERQELLDEVVRRIILYAQRRDA